MFWSKNKEVERKVEETISTEPEEIMIVGIDLGNRYAKLYTEHGNQEYSDEFMVSWKEKSEEDYHNQEINKTVTKVKYQGKFYFVGECGETGITNKNKGDESVIHDSKMVFLTLLARCMTHYGCSVQSFKVVTGTPYDYHKAHSEDYKRLMICQNEVIEVDGHRCTITVLDCGVTRQGACIIYTIPERATSNYLIWDFGGETLDVTYFEKNMRINGFSSLTFSLNRLFVEIGHELQAHKLEIDHPDMLDGRYQKSIETLFLEGHYYNTKVMKVNGKNVSIEEFCQDWIGKKFDAEVAKVIDTLRINKIVFGNALNYFVGGGAKILERSINANKQIPDDKKVLFTVPPPQFANTMAYYTLAILNPDFK